MEVPPAHHRRIRTHELPLGADRRQFVVVAAGGHWSGTSPAGDYLMAFALADGRR
ncbi:MAG: hypothetical protein R3E86_05240 [Pseudomonadales bacterium]